SSGGAPAHPAEPAHDAGPARIPEAAARERLALGEARPGRQPQLAVRVVERAAEALEHGGTSVALHLEATGRALLVRGQAGARLGEQDRPEPEAVEPGDFLLER